MGNDIAMNKNIKKTQAVTENLSEFNREIKMLVNESVGKMQASHSSLHHFLKFA